MNENNKQSGKVAVMHKKDGVWMQPEDALPFFKHRTKNTKNALKYLMNKIYNGRFPPGTLTNDHLGWWILIPHHAIEAREMKLKNGAQAKAS